MPVHYQHRFKDIEERLARLEESFNNFVKSCKYCEDCKAEKPVTEKKQYRVHPCGCQDFDMECRIHSNDDKPSRHEVVDKHSVKCGDCGLVHDTDYLHACPEKPSEFDPTTFGAVKWAEEYRRINPECDRDTMLAWFASAIMAGYDEAYRRSKDKDTISIPRSVAEEWLDSLLHLKCQAGVDVPLVNAIKQALKG